LEGDVSHLLPPALTTVSTIIPVFNRSAMLREAVASVLAQTWRPIEIIIVDDGSTDDTPKVALQLTERYPDTIRVVRQDNAGPGVARETGLHHAHGEFIQYLDSDDLLEPRKFELQIDSLRQDANAGVSYCITQRRDARTGQMLPWARTATRIEKIFPEFLPRRGWATLTPLWRRNSCDRIGPWSRLRMFEDWEHDLRAGMLGIKPVHVAVPLATIRDHDGNRASGMNTGLTDTVVRGMFLAHELVWQRMRANSCTDWAYLEAFSRTMFWIARLCGERGFAIDAERALDYVDQMTEASRQPNATRPFRRLKVITGWKSAVWLGETSRRSRVWIGSVLRSGKPRTEATK
jgi:glycosyltransferase involved in cell wall biosynthesis